MANVPIPFIRTWRMAWLLAILLCASLACGLPSAGPASPGTAAADLAGGQTESLPETVTPTLAVPPSVTRSLTPTATLTGTPTNHPTGTPTGTQTPSPTFTRQPSNTPTASHTPSITPTATESGTPTQTASPTFNFPHVTVNQQAHCRYGPARAYLHAADLYAGDTGTVRGRFYLSAWVQVKFDKLEHFCWVAPSVVEISGDLNVVKFIEVHLPGPSVLYGPPDNLVATRDGDQVTITWSKVEMTDDDDRGYFLDIFVCQDGAYLWYPSALSADTQTTFTVKDQAGCPSPSGGKIYTVEKHGYTSGVEIPVP